MSEHGDSPEIRRGTMGRPRALADDQKRRTLCAMISLGAGIEAAARHVGCSSWTVRREAQRDEAFAVQLREAQTAAELRPLQMIRQAAGTQWRAAAWLLERMVPERFVRRNPQAVTAEDVKTLLDRVATVLVDECYDESQRSRVMDGLRHLQEDQFGSERASQQGSPKPMSSVDKLLEGLQLR